MSDTEPAAITLGVCRGGSTIRHTDGSEECVACGMIVAAHQANHWLFGFAARCGSKSDD